MCQQIMQFCSGSTKPLLFAGGLLSLLLAVAIGYTGCTTHALFSDIDPQVAASNSTGYFVQLAAAGYLTLITIFSCYAAYYDQKHSIRALACISSLNFILALVAILMVPAGSDVSRLFESTLKQAAGKYDFTDKGEVRQALKLDMGILGRSDEPATMNSTSIRAARWAPDDQKSSSEPVRELNGTTATQIWDRLQARGCCGLNNATEEWKTKVPKSCCSQPVVEGDNKVCKEVDANHQQGCLTFIGSTSLNLLIVLALIALVNFYLALIAGISTYRTFHYDEASQGAYS